MKRNVILHITDLHFSQDSTAENDARKIALSTVIQTILDQPREWRPTVICLTGDIARRGKDTDFKIAEAWLLSLLEKLSLEKAALFICPGNHDIDRAIVSPTRPPKADEADKALAFPPIEENWSKAFSAFSNWAKEFGLAPYDLGSEKNYLVGQRTYRNISFIGLNTAWCCRDDHDQGKLWIGLPQIRHLEANGLFSFAHDRSRLPITVTLLHHPKEWLHPEDSNATFKRVSVWDYLSQRTDILLSGHNHGEVRRVDVVAETALHFTGGATYGGKDYANNFRLIRLENNRISYKAFEFDPRSAELSWISRMAGAPAFQRRRSSRPKRGRKAQGREKASILELLRTKSQAHASKIIERKSRAIKPFGNLPDLAALTVSVTVESEKIEERLTPTGEWKTERSRSEHELQLPFIEAINKSRKTLLVGELGMGKSTLVASAVSSLQNATTKAVAFVIPAAQIDIPNRITPVSVLDAISAYVSNAIAPSIGPIRLQILLNEHVETTLFLDGLDEVESDKRGPLLSEFAALTEHFPTISVVATGRPIEMGLISSDWKVVSPITLTEDVKEQLFRNEALATGKNLEQSKKEASELVKKLQDMPTVGEVISTPLAARLFYFRLAKGSVTEETTLGDLIYDSIHERLEGWEKRDAKRKTTKIFESYFPDSESRAALLGSVGLTLTAAGTSASNFRHLIDSRLKEIGLGPLSSACANEAIEFFAKSGIVAVDKIVQFPVQVFLQALRGLALGVIWESSTPATEISIDRWRDVAFAAAAARRKATPLTQLHRFN